MVSPTVTSLASDLAALTVRVTALEKALAATNSHEARIKALEGEMSSHQAGAVERQSEVDKLGSMIGKTAPWRPGDSH